LIVIFFVLKSFELRVLGFGSKLIQAFSSIFNQNGWNYPWWFFILFPFSKLSFTKTSISYHFLFVSFIMKPTPYCSLSKKFIRLTSSPSHSDSNFQKEKLSLVYDNLLFWRAQKFFPPIKRKELACFSRKFN